MDLFANGAGKTKFGVLDASLFELMREATVACLQDAETPLERVDAVVVANFLAGPQASQLHLNSLFSSVFREYCGSSFRVEAACASGGAAIHAAAGLLHSPGVENVLVVGVEKLSGKSTEETTANIAMAGDRELDQKNGIIFPAAYALIAQQHSKEFGTTLEDLALVSLKNHANANLNPTAHFHDKKVTLEEIRESQEVCSPLRLYDCSPLSDGAAAVLLSRNKTSRSVNLAASSLRTDSLSLCQRATLTSLPAAKAAASDALAKAKLSITDVDAFEVHDCFTIAELVAYEDLGLCKPGGAAALIRNGETTLSGSRPVNPDGGLKADGHPIGASGVAQACEALLQLRGEAGKRQVDGCKTMLCHNVGGVGGTAAVTILTAIN
ncbi:MAG: beta-ketoacyl synthase N-terminal-like domain-containing protein [Candidatus Micrarchaeota archaeon]